MKLAANRKAGINDRVISEFVYTAIYNMTPQQKSSLPGYLYRKINNESRAKRFAYKSSTDQKRELLSFFDIGFFWTFVNLPTVTAKEFLPILKALKEENPVTAVDVMASRGVCVTSDLEYAFLLGQMSQVVTSGAYVKSMELVRVGGVLRKWSKKLSVAKESEELESDAMVISKFMGAMIANYPNIESYAGVTEHEYAILNFMYQRKNKYIEVEIIWQEFAESIPQRKFPYSLNKLIKEHFLQKHADWRKKQYTITKLGIQTVHKFRERVLKTINF